MLQAGNIYMDVRPEFERHRYDILTQMKKRDTDVAYMRRAQAKAASSREERPEPKPFTSDDLQAIFASTRNPIEIMFKEGDETLRWRFLEIKPKNVVVAVEGKKRIVDYSSIVAANEVPKD